jgi:hypothetical protein
VRSQKLGTEEERGSRLKCQNVRHLSKFRSNTLTGYFACNSDLSSFLAVRFFVRKCDSRRTWQVKIGSEKAYESKSH